MANTINQPSANPTNKLTAAAVATAVWGAVIAVAGLTLQNLYPAWYDPEVLLSVSGAGSTTVAFIAGWLTSDKPNIVVSIEEPK